MKILHGFSQKEPMHTLCTSYGLEPVHVPFLEHEGLTFDEPKEIPDVVLVSSARTIQYWGVWGQWIRTHNILVIAISKKTQRALYDEGISSLCAQGTGSLLVKMLDEIHCSSFVHIGAAELSSKLQLALMDQNRPYSRIPVYLSRPNPDFTVAEDVMLGCV
ncbi:MAG: hypothetical protein CL916_09115, partial [Deltaproteobacteria bacterium]|nr:hypothetical protein [Deltaproteobacteria bacterium]